ncbi:hypothetical protein [Harryflintia acetispora]|uniref:hypothetical protein n=1 Tax=Harryflintia acetispora TaxID=1849041 RepID=UPI00256FFF9A|nr:hypothetical protein [Harryflintia acetispora]
MINVFGECPAEFTGIVDEAGEFASRGKTQRHEGFTRVPGDVAAMLAYGLDMFAFPFINQNMSGEYFRYNHLPILCAFFDNFRHSFLILVNFA